MDLSALAALWPSLLVILVLIAFSGFFSGSETALTAMSRGAMHRRAEQGSAAAREALDLNEDGERLIGAILLGNNLVNILAASLATTVFVTLFGESGVALSTLVMTFLVLIFAEVMPKTYAFTNPETAAERVARPIGLVVRLLAPVVSVVRIIVRAILRLVGVRIEAGASMLAAHEEIKGAIAMHHSEGAVQKDDRDRLLAALDLRHREVSEVMRHRSGIESISTDAAPAEILDFCLASRHTRIPLWRDEPENIVAVLHAKDMLRAVHGLRDETREIDSLDVMDVAMEPYFIPDTTSLDDQLRAFTQRQAHFALVVDEYGDLQGLVTLEDILEEIVGEIEDEHDLADQGVEAEADGSFIVDGGMTIRDLNRLMDWKLPDEEANTIAGLVIHEAQTIPVSGQVFSFHDFRFEVLERRRHQIARLRMRPLGGDRSAVETR